MLMTWHEREELKGKIKTIEEEIEYINKRIRELNYLDVELKDINMDNGFKNAKRVCLDILQQALNVEELKVKELRQQENEDDENRQKVPQTINLTTTLNTEDNITRISISWEPAEESYREESLDVYTAPYVKDFYMVLVLNTELNVDPFSEEVSELLVKFIKEAYTLSRGEFPTYTKDSWSLYYYNKARDSIKENCMEEVRELLNSKK